MFTRAARYSRKLIGAVSLLSAGFVASPVVRPASAQGAQPARPRSTVRIPLKKERQPAANVVTIHDTVTMVRVDTVRVVQTLVRTDTVFRTDTLRDSCSRGAFPVPIPVPIPIDHHQEPAVVTPQVSVTPEPATLALVGTGLAGLIGMAYYRRRK